MITDRCSHQNLNLGEKPLTDEVEKRLINALLQSMLRPETLVEHVEAGPKFIAVTAGGRMGLASLLGARPKEDETHLAEELVGRSLSQVAALLSEASPFRISLGLAAFNASNTPKAADIIAADTPAEELITELGRGKTVGLVGDFPFVSTLREQVGTFHLFELQDVPGAVPRDQWDKTLAGLDVLALTGTALLTRQMGYFLKQAAQAKTVVLGPSTPLSQALFDFGADYLCTSVVTEPERVAQGISAGLSFRMIKKNGGIMFVNLTKDEKS
ncbi:MAG: DUF364 domain-containing protein [Syntrophaceae bacterium]